MNSEVQIRLLRAMHACMRPIARILLRSGISYKQFADVAKLAFVQEAFEDAKRTGSKTNVSRVAVQTGMSRKEIHRVERTLGVGRVDGVRISTDHSGPPSKVLHEWHTNPVFLDVRGNPKELDLEGDSGTFVELVRRVTGDIPAGAIKSELLRAGAIEVIEERAVRPLKRFYVPGDVDERALTVLVNMLFPLASGIAHNSDPKRTTDGFLQRIVLATDMDGVSAPLFRQVARRRAAQFVESLDDWLLDGRDASEGPEKVEPELLGLGVFYYEGPGVDEMLVSVTDELESELDRATLVRNKGKGRRQAGPQGKKTKR